MTVALTVALALLPVQNREEPIYDYREIQTATFGCPNIGRAALVHDRLILAPVAGALLLAETVEEGLCRRFSAGDRVFVAFTWDDDLRFAWTYLRDPRGPDYGAEDGAWLVPCDAIEGVCPEAEER